MTENQQAMLRAIAIIENQVTAMLETLKEVEGADQDCVLNARTHFRKGFNLAKDAITPGELG